METKYTNSELSTYTACEVKWLLRYHYMLRPDRESDSIDLGTYFHDIADRQISNKAGFKTVDLTGDLFALSSGQVNAISVWNWFLSQAKDELEKFHFIKSEFGVDMVCSTPNSTYRGKVDALVTDRETGEKWLWDWKTTSMQPSAWLSRNPIRRQADLYVAASRRKLGVVGLVYCIVSTKCPIDRHELKRLRNGKLAKYSPSRLPRTTAREYEKAVETYGADYDTEPVVKALKKRCEDGFFFKMYRHKFNSENSRIAYREVNSLIRETSSKLEGLSEGQNVRSEDISKSGFKRNPQNCFAYNRPCPYMYFCSRGEQTVKDVLESDKFRKASKKHEEL